MFLMIKQILKFIKYIRNDISKSFLYSQACFDSIVIDKFYSIFNCKNKKFTNIVNNVENYNEYQTEKEKIIKLFDENKNDRAISFSSSLQLNYIPKIFLDIIQKHKNEIKNYLGLKVLFENPLFFRNYNFDKRFSGFDVYSNVWHQDSHDGNRLLKIFILMQDVTEEDGPIRWLDEENTRLNWNELSDRWTFATFKEVKFFKNENYLSGKAGKYCIIDTSRCMHRAGIPSEKRDMMQLTLYPYWRKKVGRNLL